MYKPLIGRGVWKRRYCFLFPNSHHHAPGQDDLQDKNILFRPKVKNCRDLFVPKTVHSRVYQNILYCTNSIVVILKPKLKKKKSLIIQVRLRKLFTFHFCIGLVNSTTSSLQFFGGSGLFPLGVSPFSLSPHSRRRGRTQPLSCLLMVRRSANPVWGQPDECHFNSQ